MTQWDYVYLSFHGEPEPSDTTVLGAELIQRLIFVMPEELDNIVSTNRRIIVE